VVNPLVRRVESDRSPAAAPHVELRTLDFGESRHPENLKAFAWAAGKDAPRTARNLQTLIYCYICSKIII